MLESADESLELLSAPSGSGLAPWSSDSGPASGRSTLRAHEKVADRQQRGHVEEVVDMPLNLVLAAPIEVLQESSRIERVGIDFEQRQVGPDRRGLHLTVPALEVFAPKLALEHRCLSKGGAGSRGECARARPTPPSGMADLPRRTDGTGAVVRKPLTKPASRYSSNDP